jgi:hypothetical protein
MALFQKIFIIGEINKKFSGDRVVKIIFHIYYLFFNNFL